MSVITAEKYAFKILPFDITQQLTHSVISGCIPELCEETPDTQNFT